MPKKAVKINKKLLRQLSESDLKQLLEDLKNLHQSKPATCCNIELVCSNNKFSCFKKFDCCGYFSCNVKENEIDAEVSVIP